MIKYVAAIPERSAQGLTARVYAQIKEDFGQVVEPFMLHSPSPRLLAAAWMAARESEVAGRVPRALKEVIAVTVSRGNACPYCVDAHAVMLHALGEHAAAHSLGYGDASSRLGERMQALAAWACATTQPGAAILRNPPFSRAEAPEIIGTAVFYHYINRMVQVLLSETPLPSRQKLLKSIFSRIAGVLFTRAAKLSKRPGASLKFLPEAALPPDLQWAQGSAAVAGAFARMAAVIADLAEKNIPARARQTIEERINAWQGAPPALGKLEMAMPGMDPDLQATAQLALSVALAPYRISPGMIYNFRAKQPEDECLLAVLAWASFTAARRIGAWLHVPDV